MMERRRAWLGDQLVTILDVSGRSKRAKVTIRDGYGFQQVVRAKDLRLVPAGEPEAKLRYVDT